uniref:Uncharacterized protein n=1 Tax=Leersia perrieri TaxID=77586 RepID=A0A0D9W3N6_9ORYZ
MKRSGDKIPQNLTSQKTTHTYRNDLKKPHWIQFERCVRYCIGYQDEKIQRKFAASALPTRLYAPRRPRPGLRCARPQRRRRHQPPLRPAGPRHPGARSLAAGHPSSRLPPRSLAPLNWSGGAWRRSRLLISCSARPGEGRRR